MAKHISSSADIRSFRGTICWMAPEVMKSSRSKKGYKLPVDIWSLACTVIEMATGKRPWHELEWQQVMYKVTSKKEIPDIPDTLSEEGKDFLKQCLKYDPASRPTADKLREHPFVKN
uniref:Protein kinase domain-containing protein n=1 Tax=Arundo donax TaxID=35708 RepID=A0A0A8ZD25_ARUDO